MADRTPVPPGHRVAAGRSGRSGRSRESRPLQVGDIQRVRMLAAMTDVLAERGVARATVEQVVSRAGVSRRTFYETFADLEDCFAATVQDALALAARRAGAAYDPDANWIDAVRAGVHALLEFFEERPRLARVLVVESLGGGRRTLARREQAIAGLIAIVDRGREHARPREALALSSLTAEGVVGGALALLHARLFADRDVVLGQLAGTIMTMVALPYLGPAAARRELERPPPERSLPRRLPRPSPDQLRKLPMRLTYRTVRVLQAAAQRPGASNRSIGIAAGIEDQGQVSKLLGRLQRIGLLENANDTATRGSPNSWTLTDMGSAVLELAGSDAAGGDAAGGDADVNDRAASDAAGDDGAASDAANGDGAGAGAWTGRRYAARNGD